MRRRLLMLVAALALAAACACKPGGAARSEGPATAPVETAGLATHGAAGLAAAPDASGSVGSATCQPCHVEAHAEWTGSQHARGFRVASIEDEDRLSSIVPCSDMTVTHVLGERHHVRFLVENPDTPWGEGRYLALPCGWDVHGKVLQMHHPESWRERPLETSCASCHVTRQRADWSWTEPGVGCESCHGNGAAHLALPVASNILSFKGKSAAEEATVCASCHLQGGTSRRTGRNFPDGYTPGGPLFDDYQFDWASLDVTNVTEAIDVHQKLLIRDLTSQAGPANPAQAQATSLRCTSCHDLHGMSHEKHASLPREPYCLTCHQPETYQRKEYRQSCPVCEF